MNFKEFIKPNAIKVILAIVLLIIGVVIGAKVSGPYGCKCHDEESCANCPQMPLILSIITYITLGPGIMVLGLMNIGDLSFTLGGIVLFLYYYIISCVIVTIYNKLKSKK